MKHTFSGLCRGGPLDGQSLEHHQNVYRIFEPPSYELLGEHWHQDGQWAWHSSSKKTNDEKLVRENFYLVDFTLMASNHRSVIP
jgi:hypothetical protein